MWNTITDKMQRALSFAHLAVLTRTRKTAKEGDKPAGKPVTKPAVQAVSSERPRAQAVQYERNRRKRDDADDDEDELSGSSPVARARRRESARCRAIMECPAARRNLALAANLAFHTRLPRGEAIAVLKDAPMTTSWAELSAERARRNPQIGPGVDWAERGSSMAAINASWDRAFAKATHQGLSPGAGAPTRPPERSGGGAEQSAVAQGWDIAFAAAGHAPRKP